MAYTLQLTVENTANIMMPGKKSKENDNQIFTRSDRNLINMWDCKNETSEFD